MGRRLIVNADDFGRSEGVNRGVVRAHERGIVTSATLMVRWPDAIEAAAYARSSSLAVGLHLDLGEWEFAEGDWLARYEVVPDSDCSAVAAELERQLDRFVELVGRAPTHLDSHQHVHRNEPVRSVIRARGSDLQVPVRGLTPEVRYSGVFYGQDGRGNPVPGAITVEGLIEALEDLPEGTTELGCHPAASVDHESTYAAERLTELQTLCDPRVADAIATNEIELISFAQHLS